MKVFKILHKDGRARAGKLTTPHGVIDTPNFIPVGTQAAVKALTAKDLKEIGNQIILANTYHLMLRPGEKLIKKLGGLHGFMSWDRPIMTDSGGFQVFSLGIAMEHGNSKVLRQDSTSEVDLHLHLRGVGTKLRLNKITEEGVTFQSHLDGSKHFLGPENSIQIQKDLGADLIVAFDDHESAKQSYEEVKKSLELTKRWALRSLQEFKKSKGAKLVHPPGGFVSAPVLYGVIHGSTFEDLRKDSAKFTDKYFDAIALGGIYGSKEQLKKILSWCIPYVSDEKPKHLLGIGEIDNLFDGVEAGIDLFDCVAPTRRARNGSLYTNKGLLNIRSSKYKTDSKPIDPICDCYTCQNFSRAYLRHLYASGELTYHTLTTYHNLYFINNLMKKIRNAIANKQFQKLKEGN